MTANWPRTSSKLFFFQIHCSEYAAKCRKSMIVSTERDRRYFKRKTMPTPSPISLKNWRTYRSTVTNDYPWIKRSALPAVIIWSCCGIYHFHFSRKSTAAPPIKSTCRTQLPNWAFATRSIRKWPSIIHTGAIGMFPLYRYSSDAL